MKRFAYACTLILIAIVAGMLGARLFSAPQTQSVKAESVYQRVLRTNTIRCGYSIWNPLFFIDEKTQEKEGIFHDMMEEAGKRLKLNIIWQEELGWGTIVESVRSGRVDMACAGYWLHPDRIKNASSTAAQLYAPQYVWVRQGESRFHNFDDLNSANVTAGLIDGGSSAQTLATRFPRAKIFSLPEMATNSDEIETLISGKADFVIDDKTTFDAYIANNPAKVQNLFPGQPVVVFPVVMLLPDDPRFKEMLDDTLKNIEYDGTLDAILKTYQMDKSFLRNPPPEMRQ